MFGFLKKQLKKGVEKLAKKVEETEEEPAKKEGAPSLKRGLKPAVESGVFPSKKKQKKPKTGKPELPPSERPIEVDEKEPEPVLVEKVETAEEPEEPAEAEQEVKLGWLKEHAPPSEERRGFLSKLKGRIEEKTLSAEDIDGFFDESETELLQNNVALEVSEFLRKELKEKLAGKPIKRSHAEETITRAFEESIFDAVNQGDIDLKARIAVAKKEGRPLLVSVIGFNGSGKTTNAAKLANYLKKEGYGVVLAAGDTFRAASIEKLELHARKLGIDIVKHKYGADAAAVIFDAVQHAKSRGLDVVLADTAGRTHTDKNLIEELKKVIRVNKPDLKILVVDSLTGNDAVEQARTFDQAVGITGSILCKMDADARGGAALSITQITGKPILFLGTGQEYDDLVEFKPEIILNALFGD